MLGRSQERKSECQEQIAKLLCIRYMLLNQGSEIVEVSRQSGSEQLWIKSKIFKPKQKTKKSRFFKCFLFVFSEKKKKRTTKKQKKQKNNKTTTKLTTTKNTKNTFFKYFYVFSYYLYFCFLCFSKIVLDLSKQTKNVDPLSFAGKAKML